MANLREVAKEAGVSIATASRILSNDESFKTTSDTKHKVYQAVNRLNYTVQPRKRILSKSKIGCILPLTSEKYSDPFFTSILQSMEEECLDLNMVISVIRNCSDLKNLSLLEELCHMQLDGLVIMEEIPNEMLSRFKKSIPNIITIDQPFSELYSVGFDHIQSNLLVLQHCFQMGYRRIAYIGGSSPYISLFDSLRLMTYREALRKQQITYDETLIKDCDWDLNLCAQCAESLLTRTDRPDVIFAGSDSLATVILSTIYRIGLSCPEDIGVIGFNNLDISAHTVPPLTTIDVPTKEIGRLTARRLSDLITRKEDTIMKISLPTTLVQRNSTAKRGI